MDTEKEIKIALLSGAIKNAGDFLIVERSEKLLKHVYPACIITKYNRLNALDKHLEEINKMDILVFAGGPGYIPGAYPNYMPLVPDLGNIKIPMFILGMGWFGRDSNSNTVYNYNLNGDTLNLIKRVANDSQYLGCRDWYSVNILRNSGISNGVMTGCPAWYDLEHVGSELPRKELEGSIRKICISDPANADNIEQSYKVAEYLLNNLGNPEITYVFHRGDSVDNLTMEKQGQKLNEIKDKLNKIGIKTKNIAYGSEGFGIYDDVDLHIGYRVHAHIYNLSKRNRSILIEEDGRGAGVNSALGLEKITAFEYGINVKTNGLTAINTFEHVSNSNIIYQLDDYINNLWSSDFQSIKTAYKNMNFYFEQMKAHIRTIDKII